MLEHKLVGRFSWYQNTVGLRFMIDFVVVVVSRIRWKGRLPDRPGKPKHVMRVARKSLAEAPAS